MDVNVTVDPWQKGLSGVLIDRLTGRIGFTVMRIELEVSGLFMMQPVMEEVRMHLITSLFEGI